MDPNPSEQEQLPENSAGGPVSRGLLRERAIELARLGGRAASEVSKADWDEARRELIGQPDVDPKQAILEAAPESERWDPVPGSPGHQAPESSPEGEDDEGRNESAQLVDEGINEAERDQLRQNARDARQQARAEK